MHDYRLYRGKYYKHMYMYLYTYINNCLHILVATYCKCAGFISLDEDPKHIPIKAKGICLGDS